MAKKGARVWGIDQSRYPVEWARFYASKEGVELHCVFIEGDASPMSFDDEFDLVLAKDIIEHIHDDVAFLRSVYNNVIPEREFLLVIQNSNSLIYITEGLWKRALKGEKT